MHVWHIKTRKKWSILFETPADICVNVGAFHRFIYTLSLKKSLRLWNAWECRPSPPKRSTLCSTVDSGPNFRSAHLRLWSVRKHAGRFKANHRIKEIWQRCQELYLRTRATVYRTTNHNLLVGDLSGLSSIYVVAISIVALGSPKLRQGKMQSN